MIRFSPPKIPVPSESFQTQATPFPWPNKGVTGPRSFPAAPDRQTAPSTPNWLRSTKARCPGRLHLCLLGSTYRIKMQRLVKGNVGTDGARRLAVGSCVALEAEVVMYKLRGWSRPAQVSEFDKGSTVYLPQSSQYLTV